MPKVFYLSRDRFPSERAHSINQIRMCDAFADNGRDVVLVYPAHSYNLPYDLTGFYGLRNSLIQSKVPCISTDIPLPTFLKKTASAVRLKDKLITDIAGLTTTLSIAAHIFWLIASKKINGADIFYGRSAYFSLFITKIMLNILGKKNKVAIELHHPPVGRLHLIRFFSKRLDKVIVINDYLEQLFKRKHFANVVALPDGVDLVPFSTLKKHYHKEDIRVRLSLPIDKKIVCYAGHLYEYKGVEDLIMCARYFPDLLFLIVGGLREDVDRCKALVRKMELNNILITGFVKPVLVLEYLFASDICVYTLRQDASLRNYTSPIKLFEYLASGNPTIAADVPGVHEIIKDGQNGLLYRPGDIAGLRKSIHQLLSNYKIYMKLAKSGFETSKRYTWTKRARKVLDLLQ